jgi:hypothetical protein
LRAVLLGAGLMFGDPWFWVSCFFFSGWCFFLFYYQPRHYWRVPPALRVAARGVLNRPIVVEPHVSPIVYADFSELAGVALVEYITTIAEFERPRRGPRRQPLDS